MIDVLLATYRPDEELLKAQIDSIRAQKGVDVKLLIREDSEGLGAARNFSALLSESRGTYVAFSDQDDVWNERKLEKSLARLKELEREFGQNTPILVFCDGYVTDADLKRRPGTFLSRQGVDIDNGLRFSRLLMQNFVAGNAMLFNAALREKAGNIPSGALMHDAWMILVAAAFGHVGWVDEPLYDYRQHGRNVMGETMADARHFLRRAREGAAAFRLRLAENVKEAEAFVERFGSEAPASAHALSMLFARGWWARRALLVRQGLYKQGVVRNLALFLWA